MLSVAGESKSLAPKATGNTSLPINTWSHRYCRFPLTSKVSPGHESIYTYLFPFNSLRPRRDRRHFADDIFKCVFLNENEWILLRISLKFVPKVRINNIPSLVQIMAWRRPVDKPLSEPMMVSLPTHICVTRPQWVNDVISCLPLHWLELYSKIRYRLVLYRCS